MPLENPLWAPVKVAFRRIADLPDLEAFVAGETYVQGVLLNYGDRFLLYDENAAGAVTGIVGSGIFAMAYDHEDGWFRPVDADDEDDFETGKKVVVQDGDFAGTWTYTGTFPTMTFDRTAYWAGIPPVAVDPGIASPTEKLPSMADTGITAPENLYPEEVSTGISGKTALAPDYIKAGVTVRITGIKVPGGGNLTGKL